jgi:glutamate dehydrogenase
VLDNYLQSALLSMESMRSKKAGDVFLDILGYLEKHGLSRTAEHFPSDDELKSWIRTGKGLPRNLLAVLVAHTKNDLYGRVLASKIPDLPLFEPYLQAYFPPKAAEKYPKEVGKHLLRREIIATVVTNAVINQAGCTLLMPLCRETNASMEDLVVRYFMIDELLGGRAFRAAVHGLDYNIAAADQYAALLAFEEVHRSLLRWWSWNESTWKLTPDEVAKTKPQFDAAADALVAALDPAAKAAYEARVHEQVGKGFGLDVAHALARAPLVRDAFALLSAVKEIKGKLEAAAPAFHRVGRELHVDAFDELLAAQIPANGWERRFVSSLEKEAAGIRQRAVAKIATSPDYVEKNKERLDRIGDALQMVRQLGQHALVPLFLILEDYRSLS